MFSANIDELPGLVVSSLAFLALLFLDRMLKERSARSAELERANQRLEAEIAEREQTEEVLNRTSSLFRITIDQMPAAVSLKDLEGRYIVVNQTFQDWFNPHRLNLGTKTVGDLVSADHTTEIMTMERTVRDSQTPHTKEMAIPLAGAGWRKALVHKFPLFDDGGSLYAIGTIETDCTELREVEALLFQSQKMEAVGQLTGGLAHDFNNLLAVIKGNAELCARERAADPCLQSIVRASDKGAKLTHRLLAFSRKQVLEPQAVDLNRSIDDIADLLRRTLGEPIETEVRHGTGLWLCEADPAQLENAVLNLALNARDAMPEGGRLTIETRNVRLDDDAVAAWSDVLPGPYAMLTVTDNGIGMAPRVVAHAFEPFFTTKPVGDGTGLGLSMVYGFVKQSGGHVAIYSAQGKGTAIELYLPRSGATEATRPRPAPDAVPRAKGETVFLVEDDPDVRKMVSKMLSGLGYKVLEAPAGAAALEMMATAEGVDLLLSDVVLPGGMSGHALAAQATRARPGLKLLHMSGYSGNAVLHHDSPDTGAELLCKPFGIDDLGRALRRVLDG